MVGTQRSHNQTQSSQMPGTVMSTEDLVIQGIHYFMILQAKKVPLKKSEIIKNALNSQSRDFHEVIQLIAETLDEVFGSKLIGMKTNDEGHMEQVPVIEAQMFMTISIFNTALIENNGMDQGKEKIVQQKKALTKMILNTLYMHKREIDEDFVWQIISEMQCAENLCPRREDLRKLLKMEYVDPMYLNRQETKGPDGSTFRYIWGFRAELECDKYQMLKDVARVMHKLPHDFKTHYFELLKDKKYTKRLEEDRKKNPAEADSLFDNTTASAFAGISDDDEILDIETQIPRKKRSVITNVDLSSDSDSSSESD